MSEPNIEVVLTDASEFHCFKLIFRAAPKPGEECVPIEIMLHTTQAIDLFTKLAMQLAAYMNQTVAAVADVVLAYRPKSKQPKPRKRKKAAKRA